MRNLPDSPARRVFGAVAAWQGSVPAVWEFIRYGATSGLALTADFLSLVLLTEFAGLHYLVSSVVGFAAGMVIAYVLSVRWVFSARRLSNATAEGTIFILIGIAGLLINQAVLYSLTEGALLPYAASKAVSACIVFTFNFSVRKFALFTAPATRGGVAL